MSCSKIKPIRLQRRRVKGFRLVSPNGLPNLYVGRSSPHGNPYQIGKSLTSYQVSCLDKQDRKRFVFPYILTREDCIYLFEKYESLTQSEFKEAHRGKNLVCFCPLNLSCHSDVLLKLWNE